jgi:hypothetical protein
MSTQPDETEIERQFIEDVRRACGPLLSTFLLAGYGREQLLRVRAFSVTSRVAHHPAERRLVQMRNDGSMELPHGREPLVWAVLLQELFVIPRRRRELFLYHRQVLEALGWDDTAEGRALVQSALIKYTDLTILDFAPLRPTTKPPTDFMYTTTLHPVVECQTVMTSERGFASEDASFRMEFSETFISGLMSGGLFGAEWIEIIDDSGVMRLGEETKGLEGSDNQ